MALSFFDDKSSPPTDAELKTALGRTATHWDSLITHIATEFPPLDKTWGYAGAKWGWSLRLKQKKRTVLYMTPCPKHFLVGFALGEKAVRAAHAVPLPEEVLSIIDEAPRYPEGRGVRIEVRNKRNLQHSKQVAAVKMAN